MHDGMIFEVIIDLNVKENEHNENRKNEYEAMMGGLHPFEDNGHSDGSGQDEDKHDGDS